MQVLHTHDRLVGSYARHGRLSEAVEPAGRFGLHFLEMCVVMCVGGGLLTGVAFAGAWLAGFDDVVLDSAVWSPLLISVMMALAMTGWMRFRRMDWRPTLEMAFSSVVAGGVLVVGYRVGIVSATALVPSVCPVACVAMIVVMLFRLPLYTSGHAHHGEQA
jgi:hypothetical protein